MSDPHVSLIVCTRNRAPSLTLTLQSVADAFRAAPQVLAELVLVDNGSTDDTAAVVERFDAASPDVSTTYVFEGRPGLAGARNAGIAAARGRWLAFTDDDCQLTRTYLADLWSYVVADTDPVLRGGRVELGDPLDAPMTIKLDPNPAELSANEIPGGFIHGCNMVMPRALFDVVGPFDERFGAGAPLKSGEDTDYMLRARRAGFAVRYVPNMAVKHFHGRRSREQLAKLNRQYEFGNGALLVKHIRSEIMLAKVCFWNVKDMFAEALGRLPSLRPIKGISRGQVFKENLAGALALLRLGAPAPERREGRS